MAVTGNGNHLSGEAGRLLIVGIGGTTRIGSNSEQALRYALQIAAEAGADTLLFGSAHIQLPLYQPNMAERVPPARRLVEALRAAAGVIVSSPCYHGSLSGLIKNALDYAEDLREDRWPYFEGRAMGCIATGAGWQAPAATLGHLRSVGHALRAWPTPLGVAMNSTEGCFDVDGLPVEPYRQQLALMARHVVGFARSRSPLLDVVGLP